MLWKIVYAPNLVWSTLVTYLFTVWNFRKLLFPNQINCERRGPKFCKICPFKNPYKQISWFLSKTSDKLKKLNLILIFCMWLLSTDSKIIYFDYKFDFYMSKYTCSLHVMSKNSIERSENFFARDIWRFMNEILLFSTLITQSGVTKTFKPFLAFISLYVTWYRQRDFYTAWNLGIYIKNMKYFMQYVPNFKELTPRSSKNIIIWNLTIFFDNNCYFRFVWPTWSISTRILEIVTVERVNKLSVSI